MGRGINPDDDKGKGEDANEDQGQGEQGQGQYDPFAFLEAGFGMKQQEGEQTTDPRQEEEVTAEDVWGTLGMKPPDYSADQSKAPPITEADLKTLRAYVRGELQDKEERRRIFRLCYAYTSWAEEKRKALIEWASESARQNPWWQEN